METQPAARLLDRVSVNAAVVARVVGDVVTAEDGPDVTTLRRIDQERTAAASRVLKDRDYVGLQQTMERLDREEQEARRPRQREGVPAEKAVEYLQALGDAWRFAEGEPGRAMVARSVFERLEASGFRELKVHLTEEARAHAFAAAVPEQFTASVVSGRGERSQPDTSRLFIRASWPWAPTARRRDRHHAPPSSGRVSPPDQVRFVRVSGAFDPVSPTSALHSASRRSAYRLASYRGAASQS